MGPRVSRREFLDASAVVSAAAMAGCVSIGLPDPTGHPTVTECEGGHVFRNWANTITCAPREYCQPETQDQVVKVVKKALADGTRVRTVGAGHSWAPLVLTKDTLLNLDRMQGIVSVDKANHAATVQAGVRLKNLTSRLADPHGLGMQNLGSIRQQSIAGAIATGTHGTGLRLGSIPTQVIGLTLVTGSGDVLNLTANDGDVFFAARLSLGALGIVTEVTLQCVENYQVEFIATWCKFDDALSRIDSLNARNERVRFWWLVPPGGPRERDDVIVSTMNGVPAGSATRPGAALRMDVDELRKKRPRSAECTEFLRYTANYAEALGVPLLPVYHRECEYAVPVERAAEALQAFRRALDEGDLDLRLPVEVRFVAKDESLLSPARGRDVCYIGASTQDNAAEVFERFEPIVKRLGGRPHWGKCFTLTQRDAAEMYPDSYGKFKRIRKDLDPKGVFSNELLQTLFD